MSTIPNCESIADSALGQELDLDECRVLSSVMEIRQLKDGETLVKEGQNDSTLFVLISGKLAVQSAIQGKETTVYTMKVGECAGTRAFVDRAPRRATLKAVGNTTIYSMAPERFETLLDSHPRVVYKVMRGLFRITHKNLMRMNVETQQLSNYINKTGGRY
jgi:CRP/FNR family cyclic AMP-dependent transcriptional regulator